MSRIYRYWAETEIEYFDIKYLYFDGEVEVVDVGYISINKASEAIIEFLKRDYKYPNEIEGNYFIEERVEIEWKEYEEFDEYW